jgi:hypothetical protein
MEPFPSQKLGHVFNFNSWALITAKGQILDEASKLHMNEQDFVPVPERQIS